MSNDRSACRLSRERSSYLPWALLLGAVLVLEGCTKPPMRDGFTEVYGTITMDGAPLVDAQIILETPQGKSFGRTDQAGRYVIEYSRSLKGAAIGNALVRISTAAVFRDDPVEKLKYNNKTDQYFKDERVPARYNVRSDVHVQITEEGSPYDFQLTSK